MIETRTLRMLAGLLLAGIVAVVVAATASATAPGVNGLLVFTVQVGPHTQLYTARPDGAGVTQVTHFADGTDALNASWSPDGSHIAFERDFPVLHAGIYTIKADGSGLASLTKNKLNYYEGEPSYSPNGRLLAYGRQVSFTPASTGPRDHNEVWVRGLGGRGARQVSPKLLNGRGDHTIDHPEFSPDGTRIVYAKHLGSKAALFVINVNGTGLHQVTPLSLGVDDRIDWSPDGSLILFSSGGTSVNLYTVHPDGSGLTQLTHAASGTADKTCSWSPDGRQIMFVQGSGESGDVYVMDANGANATQVTHGLAVHGGSWGSHS